MKDVWAGPDNVGAFQGISVESMPNYGYLYRPGSAIGQGSSTRACGWACDFMLRMCRKIATKDIK